MLAHFDYNNILIDTYKGEIFLTFMSAEGVYLTRIFN